MKKTYFTLLLKKAGLENDEALKKLLEAAGDDVTLTDADMAAILNKVL